MNYLKIIELANKAHNIERQIIELSRIEDSSTLLKSKFKKFDEELEKIDDKLKFIVFP